MFESIAATLINLLISPTHFSTIFFNNRYNSIKKKSAGKFIKGNSVMVLKVNPLESYSKNMSEYSVYMYNERGNNNKQLGKARISNEQEGLI